MGLIAPELVALLFALLLDALFGEPRNALHPVAWFGVVAGWFTKRAPRRPPLVAFFSGTFITLVAGAGAFALGSLIEAHLDGWAGVVALSLCLKPTFALRALGEAGERMARHLRHGDIEGARASLGWLCSRDAEELDEPALAASTIESLAENTSDSFVAPLFYFALFGLPGAMAFRAVNTLDAMIGYRDERVFVGKFAARLDDVLCFVPARLTGVAMLLAAGGRGAAVMLRDARLTSSPNAGWPMAAMAGALGVRLWKADVYELGADGRSPTVADIDAAWRICGRASAITVLVVATTIVFRA